MSTGVDGRGSKPQRLLYNYLLELYPNYDIIYEYPLYKVNQRVDLFIPNIGLAVEYSGRQHYEYIEHFHRDPEGFKKSKAQDQKKLEYLYSHGIKLVEIPYNKMVNNKEELKTLIDSIDYPNVDYVPIEKISDRKDQFLKNQRQHRAELYHKIKDKIKEEDEDKELRLEQQRQYRKEAYKKYKESKLK